MTTTVTVAPSPALSAVDRAARLATAEQRIADSQRTFMEALYDIYIHQLWLDTDASFDAYLARRWQYKDRYRRYLRAAVENINDVLVGMQRLAAAPIELQPVPEDDAPVGLSADWESAIEDAVSGTVVPVVPNITIAPETVTRPLSALHTPEAKAAAWMQAAAASGGDMPATAQVKAAVEVQHADSQADTDRLFVAQYTEHYPYIVERLSADTLTLKVAVLLVKTLNSITTRPRNVAVKAMLTDVTLISELNRICPSDTFDEIEASGVLELPNGYVPLAKATAVHLRTMLDARRKMHKTLAREAAFDLEVFKADVVEIGTDVETWAGSQTEVVFVTMIMPKAVADKLTTEKRYSFTVEVPKREVR